MWITFSAIVGVQIELYSRPFDRFQIVSALGWFESKLVIDFTSQRDFM